MTQFPHLSHEWFGLDRGPSQHILDGGLHRNHLEKYFKIQIPGPILWKICFTVGGGGGGLGNHILLFKIFIYLLYLLAALGLRCRTQAFLSSCVKQGLLFIAVRGLLIAVASLAVEHGF